MNPVIRGEDAGQLLLKFQNGATAFWDANRYNESEAESPRFTFGELRIDGTGGHLTMDAASTIRVKRLGEPLTELHYARERKNFAGDCVYFLQRHFVDCLVSGQEFETNGVDYLKNVRIVDAAYESARLATSFDSRSRRRTELPVATRACSQETQWIAEPFSPQQHCPPSIRCAASPRPGAPT